MNKRFAIIAGIAVVGALAFKPAQQAINNMLKPVTSEQQVLTLIFQQRSAEYRALCFQAYNNAMDKVDEATRMKRKKKRSKLAIVTDLDETALDNSGYAVRCYHEKHGYSNETWAKWCDDAVADSVPGSVAFFNYADRKGVQIFYVSNRSGAALASTMINMKRLGFPQVTEEHFKLKTTPNSSKEARRLEIEKTHKIVLFLGDNLLDMDKAFDGATEVERQRAADSLRGLWGSRYIVIPNPTYGDWENVLYADYRKRHPSGPIPVDTMYSIRAASLKNY